MIFRRHLVLGLVFALCGWLYAADAPATTDSNRLNIVSLREYVERRLADQKELFEKSQEAQDAATSLARLSMEKRLEGMNEFRDALKDQTKTFITRTEHDMVLRQISSLELTRAEMAGKASEFSVIMAYCLGGIALLFSVLSLALQILKVLHKEKT